MCSPPLGGVGGGGATKKAILADGLEEPMSVFIRNI